LGNVEVRLVSTDGAPVRSDTGLIYPADASFATCPKDLDILFVPGGLKGSIKQMRDPATLDFLADRGARAKYITGICTGTLVLGAAGLLKGYKATGNWQVRQLLPLMGAELVPDRVVIDRNRITGAGVTAGIDFGLQIVAMLRGEPYARMLQLVFEYDPHPPFNSGSPTTASKALVDHLMTSRAADIEAARLAAVASPAG
ncbi:MAG: DJ-1/PfpI family protein, partial [Phenylobacterium sp.]|uniref:DJ-1/PfpI family protein n=1 Tax=Phenylobacterium sp. TaxID=1871053 RepID=UPI00273275EB